jgi:hypothetical protein
MKGMQKIKRGDNFRGALDYAFDRDKNEEKAEGFIVGGNMSGTNAKELTAEFLRFADARKDIKKPVWHNSLRVPVGDDLTDDEWNKVGVDYMERMGFDPKLNQFVFIKHDDEEGKHIHIIGSRIDMLGNVWFGRNENIISTRIISELEIDHNLTQTKNLNYTKDEQGNYHIAERSPGRGRTLSRAEELMQSRKQWTDIDYLAPKQHLANAVTAALENQPTTEQFINTLEAENIQVQCVVKKGQMVGFSFAMNGENFKGSQVGANWKDITNERKLNYEHERDAEIIASRRYGTSSKKSTGVESTPRTDAEAVKRTRKQRAVADTGLLERDSRGRFIPSSEPAISNDELHNLERQPSGPTYDIGEVENPEPIETEKANIDVDSHHTINNKHELVGMAALQKGRTALRANDLDESIGEESTGNIKPNIATGTKEAVITSLFDDVADGVKVVKTLDALDKMDKVDVAKAKVSGAPLVTVASAETRELAQAGTNVVEAFELPSELIKNYGQTDYETELEDKKPKHIKDREKSVFNPSTPGQKQGFNPEAPGPKQTVQDYEKTLSALSDEHKAKQEAQANGTWKPKDDANER